MTISTRRLITTLVLCVLVIVLAPVVVITIAGSSMMGGGMMSGGMMSGGMMSGGMMSGGMIALTALQTIAILVLIAAAVTLLVGWLRREQPGRVDQHAPNAVDIAAQRYAAGEIDQDEYDRIRQHLERTSSAAR